MYSFALEIYNSFEVHKTYFKMYEFYGLAEKNIKILFSLLIVNKGIKH